MLISALTDVLEKNDRTTENAIKEGLASLQESEGGNKFQDIYYNQIEEYDPNRRACLKSGFIIYTHIHIYVLIYIYIYIYIYI